MSIKTIVFDMDGVIFDSEKMMQDIFMELGEKLQLPDNREIVNEFAGMAGSFIKQKMGEYLGDEKKGKKYYNKFCIRYVIDVVLRGVPVKNGIEELLKYLKERGYAMAVASSSKTLPVKYMLKKAGLKKYFKEITGGDKIKHKKPAPDIYLLSCKKLNVEPRNCYAVEDSVVGAKSAIAAGMKVFIIPDLQQPDEYNRENAEKVFLDAIELKNYLFALDNQKS